MALKLIFTVVLFVICFAFLYILYQQYIFSKSCTLSEFRDIANANKKTAFKSIIRINSIKPLFRYYIMTDKNNYIMESSKKINDKKIQEKIGNNEEIEDIKEFSLYTYIVRVHGMDRKIISDKYIRSKKFIGYKNPFYFDVYLTDMDLEENNVELIDEKDLLKKIPRKLLKYLYDDNKLEKLFEIDNKKSSDKNILFLILSLIFAVTLFIITK